MDLLLTHGYFLSEDAQERQIMRPYPPLGLLYISSYLKAGGFDVEVFDTTFNSWTDFTACLDRVRPQVVGIYCNMMTKITVLRMIAACRQRGAVVVLGGPEPPHHADPYLEHGADIIVVGEGEVTMAELLPRLIARPADRDLQAVHGLIYRDRDGATVRTPPRELMADLNAPPGPDREAIDIQRYLDAWRGRHGVGSVSLITARGCPYTCRWCSRAVFGETYRRRTPVHVADEVEDILQRYRPDRLWYVDDVFTIHRGWMLGYAAEMERRRCRVPFECISRPERIDDAVADALASLGCARLWLGSESGSQQVLDAMDRRITIDQVHHATRLLQKRGIEVGMFIMLGYDGEEFADLAETVEQLKRMRPDVFLTTVAYPIKGTPYYTDVEDRIRTDAPWAERTDRDVRIAGRHSQRYYQFARRWINNEVERNHRWRQGRYLSAVRAAASAGVARVGLSVTSRQRDA